MPELVVSRDQGTGRYEATMPAGDGQAATSRTSPRIPEIVWDPPWILPERSQDLAPGSRWAGWAAERGGGPGQPGTSAAEPAAAGSEHADTRVQETVDLWPPSADRPRRLLPDLMEEDSGIRTSARRAGGTEERPAKRMRLPGPGEQAVASTGGLDTGDGVTRGHAPETVPGTAVRGTGPGRPAGDSTGEAAVPPVAGSAPAVPGPHVASAEHDLSWRLFWPAGPAGPAGNNLDDELFGPADESEDDLEALYLDPYE